MPKNGTIRQREHRLLFITGRLFDQNPRNIALASRAAVRMSLCRAIRWSLAEVIRAPIRARRHKVVSSRTGVSMNAEFCER